MASSDNEKNHKNAKILQANVFYNDLICISQFAFKIYDARKHTSKFIEDIIEFNHLMLEMLDEYSKGKVLTIQTQKKRKVKKNKKKHNDDIYSDDELNGDDDDFEDEENVERNFNFVKELCQLVDYDVVDRYL